MIKFKLVVVKNKLDANGQYPIYLRITQYKTQRFINTGQRCNPKKEWDKNKEMLIGKHDDLKRANNALAEIKNKWVNHYLALPIDIRESINVEAFIKLVEGKKQNFDTLDYFALVKSKIEDLQSIGQISTANWHKDTMNTIILFELIKEAKAKGVKDTDKIKSITYFKGLSKTKTPKLNIENMNVEWLKKYELHLRQRKYKESSISVRMRSIRVIFNDCIENGLISQDKYPFKQFKISKFKSNKNPRAISIDDIKKIESLDTTVHDKLKLSKDLFLFSYYSGGINFKDMLQLERSQIYNENSRITYIRSKTNRRLDFKLSSKAQEIVEYYSHYRTDTKYLFPLLLMDNLTPMQIYNRRHKTISQFNKDLKMIGLLCDIEFDLTSYVARHTFANTLKSKGIPTDVISETMDHKNIKTTQGYLKRLENSVIDDAMDSLID
jgi:integrase/recombinase XerD